MGREWRRLRSSARVPNGSSLVAFGSAWSVAWSPAAAGAEAGVGPGGQEGDGRAVDPGTVGRQQPAREAGVKG